MYPAAIQGQDPVSCFQSGFLGSTTIHDLRSYRITDHDQIHHNEGNDKAQNKVKYRSCQHSGNPRPHIGIQERAAVVFPVFLFIQTVLALKHTGSANGKKLQGIFGISLLEGKQIRTHTYRKFYHMNSIGFRQQKMSEFM